MQSMKVINVKKEELNKNGYNDIEQWQQDPNHLYIGRAMNYPKLKIKQSKWANPFPVTRYGLDDSLRLYEEYVNTTKLRNDLEELEGLTLGCWCYPEKCHGDILIKMLQDKKNSKC